MCAMGNGAGEWGGGRPPPIEVTRPGLSKALDSGSPELITATPVPRGHCQGNTRRLAGTRAARRNQVGGGGLRHPGPSHSLYSTSLGRNTGPAGPLTWAEARVSSLDPQPRRASWPRRALRPCLPLPLTLLWWGWAGGPLCTGMRGETEPGGQSQPRCPGPVGPHPLSPVHPQTPL